MDKKQVDKNKSENRFVIYIPKITTPGGGVLRVAYQLTQRLDMHIITSYYRDDIENFFPGIKKSIIKISSRKKEPTNFEMVLDFLNYKDDKVVIHRFPKTIFLSSIKGDKYLWYTGGIPHHWNYKHMNKNFSNLLKYLSVLPLKFFYRFLDHEKVIANSTMTSDNIKKFTGKIPRYVLPPPLDFKRFKKGKSKDYFLTVSRLVPYKRIGWQIKAFKDTKKRLVIVGYGELFERYKRITRGMKNVEVRSPPSDSELIKLYAGCEAFIFTSYREHFGMTPLEAMASGKPVISTKDGGGPLDYIKEGKNGFFANNVSELRSMVLSLEKKDLEKMEKECIETARNYSFDVFVQKFSKILEEQFP